MIPNSVRATSLPSFSMVEMSIWREGFYPSRRCGLDRRVRVLFIGCGRDPDRLLKDWKTKTKRGALNRTPPGIGYFFRRQGSATIERLTVVDNVLCLGRCRVTFHWL